MHRYPIVISVDHQNGVLRRWIVISQGRRSTLTHYLFGKLLWDELSKEEREVFWRLPEVLNNKTIFITLKAINLIDNKKLVRERLLNSPFPELQGITRQQYLSIKGRVTFLLYEEKINLRKTPKYSGYTRHYKDKGQLGLQREEILSEILDPVYDVTDEVLLNYLTVGEISLLDTQVRVHLPDETQ